MKEVISDEGEWRSLTGAMSRRQFLDVAKAEVARSRRYRNPLSCLVVEIEHSKSNADVQDPAIEDLVLQNFVSVCKSTLRTPDYLGRIGRAEFSVMLPETPLLGALGVAERILANLAAEIIDASQHQLTATTSIGVVEYSDQTWSLDQLLEAAVAAMHDARHNGSNQAVCYLDDLQLTSVTTTVN